MRQAAAAAAGGQHYPPGSLYVVATPIGNRADMTLRAIHVLTLVDAIACEDTRHSAALLRQFGLDQPLMAVHQPNEREAADAVMLRLARGERVAYISDAGTPAISDPGAALVDAVRAGAFRAIPIPGASSAAAALSVAGDASGSAFTFIGFLPARGPQRAQALKQAAVDRRTQVVFEAPHRIDALADALADACAQSACADRRITVCRELTKQFETVETMPASVLPGWLAADANRSRGEFVLVMHALAEAEADSDASAQDSVLNVLMAELPLKQAVAIAASLTGVARNALYDRALVLKRDREALNSPPA